MTLFKASLLATVAVVLGGAIPARALTIDFNVVGLGSTPSYTGPSLTDSTSFNFGGGLDLVNQKGTFDQSGLGLGTFLSLPSSISYGSGSSGSTAINFNWTDSLGTFEESLTSFTVKRTTDNSIVLTLLGDLVGPDVSGPAAMILSASQAGGAPNTIGWIITNTTLYNTVTPLPTSLVLFGSVFAGAGALMLRRRSALLGRRSDSSSWRLDNLRPAAPMARGGDST